MAVYPKLLLSTGGGIVSSKQQAKQIENTATLLIGLGGTGVDCIRMIKTQVYDRLEPDKPESEIPEYSHIQFLGVDADEKQKGDSTNNSDSGNKSEESLNLKKDDEFLSIANQSVRGLFEPDNYNCLKQKEELSWLEYESIEPTDMAADGAGGNRQVGRLMLMNKSQKFYSMIEEKIENAKMDLKDPKIFVHIFSGLSGGTGSGCFLDVCYTVKDILQGKGTIFGYFFLPDVNLSHIPQSQKRQRQYIPKNGYAAMQELDYCMRLSSNGGVFRQTYYQGRKINWSGPPVNMCHLVCATDQGGNVRPYAYDYAMHVTTEYVMDMLTDSGGWTLTSHLSNFGELIGTANANKKMGVETAYCTIGASCASIPLREINTYLASELFAKFAVTKSRTPTEQDVKDFLFPALYPGVKSDRELYDSLLAEIQAGIGEYEPYPDDWRSVVEGDGDFTEYYVEETSERLGVAEKNVESMISDNKSSLFNRIQSKLDEVICDIDKGPFYAYCLIDGAVSHSILNVIDGLIERNRNQWNERGFQWRNGVRKEYENAREDFLNRHRRVLFDNDKKRFEAYEAITQEQEKCKLFLGPEMEKNVKGEVTGIYEKMDIVLQNLKDRLTSAREGYYKILRNVVDTIIDTFVANKNDLAGERMKTAGNSFNTPLVTVSELKTTLDGQIANLNARVIFEKFMSQLIKDENVWITEKENEISHFVTKFFMENAFPDFAGRTITDYLQDKYNTQNTDILAGHIEKEINTLATNARPLFYFNQNIWTEEDTAKLEFISYPQISPPISTAAERKYPEQYRKASALTDRIFILSSACGFPLSTYNNCKEYEQLYYSSRNAGRHYYEGKPVEGMKFTDWNKLPPITPQSLITLVDGDTTDRANLVRAARSLFENAKRFGVIGDGGEICKPNESEMARLKDICDQCEQKMQKAGDKKEQEKLKKNLESLLPIKLELTGNALPTDGSRASAEVIREIQKDYFVSSPAFHSAVKQYVQCVEDITNRINTMIERIEATIKSKEAQENNMTNYCNALFTGIIKLQGKQVTYEGGHFGNDVYELSKMGDGFPYGHIAAYQGFVKYCGLEEDVKKEIAKKANDMLNLAENEVAAYVPIIEGELKTNIKRWEQIAQKKENHDEIREFLIDMMEKLDEHCLSYSIVS